MCWIANTHWNNWFLESVIYSKRIGFAAESRLCLKCSLIARMIARGEAEMRHKSRRVAEGWQLGQRWHGWQGSHSHHLHQWWYQRWAQTSNRKLTWTIQCLFDSLTLYIMHCNRVFIILIHSSAITRIIGITADSVVSVVSVWLTLANIVIHF